MSHVVSAERTATAADCVRPAPLELEEEARCLKPATRKDDPLRKVLCRALLTHHFEPDNGAAVVGQPDLGNRRSDDDSDILRCFEPTPMDRSDVHMRRPALDVVKINSV